MSEIESRFVHQGIWVDVGKGTVMGSTITTDTRTGTIVVALLAILCSLSMAHVWHLVMFFIHQVRSARWQNNAIFRQQQAVLRSLSTPMELVTDFAKIWWAWRRTDAPSLWSQSLPLMSLAALFTAATVATGIFSSYIVDSSDINILVDSRSCGTLEPTVATIGLMSNYIPLVKRLAQEISDECYQNNEPTSARCRIYPRTQIDFDVKRADCPWDSPMCNRPGQNAVSVDSGLLHLNSGFGLNLPREHPVHYRRKNICSVLPLENRTSIVAANEYPFYSRPPLPQEELLIISLGNISSHGEWANVSFVSSLTRANTSDEFAMRSLHSYNDPKIDGGKNGWIKFIPELSRNGADTVVKLAMKNKVVYENPVNDPFFSAHVPWTEPDGNRTIYFSDFPASAVGCTSQYQFCTTKDRCTELSYLPSDLTNAELPDASDMQLAAIRLLLASLYFFNLASAESLRASKLLRTGGYISSLPDEQWIEEVVGWESAAWAAMQVSIADFFTGAQARDSTAGSYVKPASTEGERTLCSMMKMRRSGGFANINVFALALVCTFTVVIFTLDTTLLRFLIFLSGYRRTRWLGPPIEHWTADGVLQIQRRVFELEEGGNWRHLDKEIPVRDYVAYSKKEHD